MENYNKKLNNIDELKAEIDRLELIASYREAEVMKEIITFKNKVKPVYNIFNGFFSKSDSNNNNNNAYSSAFSIGLKTVLPTVLNIFRNKKSSLSSNIIGSVGNLLLMSVLKNVNISKITNILTSILKNK